ncbi:MAG TPA: cupredoxin domain-containing protein, partial [Anaerolineales bacterium]
AACGGAQAVTQPAPQPSPTTQPAPQPAATQPAPQPSATTEPAPQPSAATQSEAAVTIQGFAFGPDVLTVKVGTKVTWTNKDGTTHTVTSDSGAWNTARLSPGATFARVFDQAGSFGYHCSIHSTMTGTIVVTP